MNYPETSDSCERSRRTLPRLSWCALLLQSGQSWVAAREPASPGPELTHESLLKLEASLRIALDCEQDGLRVRAHAVPPLSPHFTHAALDALGLAHR